MLYIFNDKKFRLEKIPIRIIRVIIIDGCSANRALK